MDQNKIGKHIEELRKEKGLTQRDLAEKLGISNTAISKWECGCNLPDISMLEPLSQVLNVDIMELINPQKRTVEDKKKITKLEWNKLKKILLIMTNVTACVFILIISVLLSKKTTNAKNIEIAGSNKIKVYEITSDDPTYYINGYLMFNENEDYFILNKFEYQGSDIGPADAIYAKEATLFLMVQENIIYQVNIKSKGNKICDINEILMDLTENINEHKKIENNLMDYEEHFDNIQIRIKYKNKKDENQEIDIKISTKQLFT